MGKRDDVSDSLAAGKPAASLPVSPGVSVDALSALVDVDVDGKPKPTSAVAHAAVAPVPSEEQARLNMKAALKAIEAVAVGNAGVWLADPVIEPEWLLRMAWDGTTRAAMGRNEPGCGVLRQGIVALLAASGGSGKSQLLIQLLLSIVLERQFVARFDVSGGGVGCVWAEEDGAELHRRLRNTLGCEPGAGTVDLFRRRVRVLPARRMPVALLRDVQEWRNRGDGFKTAEVVCTATVFADALGEWLKQQAPEGGYKAIILDPSARFAPAAAETDNSVATRYVEILERLTDLPGRPTILLAHHTAKGAAGGQGAARGASALVDGSRFMWLLQTCWIPKGRAAKKEGEKDNGAAMSDGWLKTALTGGRRILKLSVEKTNYTMPHKPVFLEWHKGELCALSDTGAVERGSVVP